MGRRKLEMKRIEDKSSRQVTFSKRRTGLMKKAQQLSVLCDIEIAVVIFSSRGKLYEFCSGNSLHQILRRYEKSCLEVETSVANGACEAEESHPQSANFRTSGELLQMVQRYTEEPCMEQLSVTDLVQLEEELDATLMQTRSRKTQLMMEYAKTLREKGKMLWEENNKMEEKIAEMENGDNRNEAEGLDGLATNQINCCPKPLTLPLFIK